MPADNVENLYGKDDYQIYNNVLVVKYFKVVFNRHEHGFEKGVSPLLTQCRQKSIDTVLIDLDGTTFIESLTLGSIVKFKKEIAEAGMQTIRLLNPSPEVGETILMQNLDKILGEPFYSLEEALKQLKK